MKQREYAYQVKVVEGERREVEYVRGSGMYVEKKP